MKLLRRDALNGEAFGSYRVIDKRELANDFRKIFIEQVVQPPEQNAAKTVAHWHPEKCTAGGTTQIADWCMNADMLVSSRNGAEWKIVMISLQHPVLGLADLRKLFAIRTVARRGAR